MNSYLIRNNAMRAADVKSVCDAIHKFSLLSPQWRVTIEEAKSLRSHNQNRFLWGVCYPAFLKYLEGWESEDIHEYMLGEHFGWEVVEGFGKKRQRPIRRSSKLSKAEFADFVAFIQRKGAELGIFIEDPIT